MLWTDRIACLMLIPPLGATVWEVVARKLFVAPTHWV